MVMDVATPRSAHSSVPVGTEGTHADESPTTADDWRLRN